MHTKPPPHLGLHHVALFVSNLDAARHFYVDLLGFRVEWEPDADNIYLTSGCDNLALHRGPVPEVHETQRLDHIGIVVAEAAHVSLWETYLRENSVRILKPTRTHRDGATSCYVQDPEGLSVQIIHILAVSRQLSAVSG